MLARHYRWSLWAAFGICVGTALVSSPCQASPKNSPVGYWKMIHDKTKKPAAIVKLWQQGGKLYAKTVKLFLEKGEDPNPNCTKCSGWRKNKPIIGMLFVWNLTKTGPRTWSKGKILDPDEGKTYGCKMWLDKDGKTLQVRGYLWIFFRTQTWYRVPAPGKAKKTPKG